MPVPPNPRHISAYQRIFAGGDGQLESWLREIDRTGALPEQHAAIDHAYARGHVAGLEEGRAEHLDATKTLLLSMLEMRFGPLNDEVLDRIDDAHLPRLQRWILATVDAQCMDEIMQH
jgi:hypothetical protein